MKTIFQALLGYLANLGQTFGRGWNEFWFRPSAPHTLGAIRICTGLILVYVHLTTFHRLLDMVGPHAFIDQQAVQQIDELPKKFRADFEQRIAQGEPVARDFNVDDVVHASTWYRFTLYEYITNPFLIQVVHGGFVVAMICFTIGLGTRVTAVLAWLGHLSYINRGYTIWFGMDSMLLFISFYLMFAPCGWAYSVDRLLARWRSIRRTGNSREPIGVALPAPLHWSTTTFTRMIQIHMGIVYLCAGVAKLQGATWWSGYATWMTMNTSEFALVDMRWLGQLPDWVWNSITTATTYATLAFELAFIFLIWYSFWRPILLFSAVLLHAGIGFFMGLVAFGNIMLTGCMSFIPPESVDWFVRSLFAGKRRYTFRYSRMDSVSVRQATLLKTVDVWDQIRFEDTAQDAPTAGGKLVQADGIETAGRRILLSAWTGMSGLWLSLPFVALVFPGGGSSTVQNSGGNGHSAPHREKVAS